MNVGYQRFKNVFLIFGIVGPMFIFLSTTLFGFLLPGYNFIEQYLSVLGSRISPFAVFFNIFVFGCFGVFMMGLGYIFSMTLARNYFSQVADKLLIGSGVLLILLGIFPTDPTINATTFEGKTHSIIGVIGFIMLPLAVIWFGEAFGREEGWRSFWRVISYILACI